VNRYVIRGGREGYNRLLLLARASWPDTAALFSRAGIRPGMQCVDLGCGGGEVTFELAKLVAPGGSVTGVDMDEVKLGLARNAAVERGLSNVEFLTRERQQLGRAGHLRRGVFAVSPPAFEPAGEASSPDVGRGPIRWPHNR
jgi:2-polyprenyl-3-methyl-5-hydroxy-6-metoxy-1,4-benzoquinol methylase